MENPKKPRHTPRRSEYQIAPELLTTLIGIQESLKKTNSVPPNKLESLHTSVESIKTSQKSVQDQIDAVDKVFYEPDDGIFARVKTVERRVDERFHTQERENTALANRISILEKNRDIQNKVVWLLIPLVGSVLFKGIWDFLTKKL